MTFSSSLSLLIYAAAVIHECREAGSKERDQTAVSARLLVTDGGTLVCGIIFVVLSGVFLTSRVAAIEGRVFEHAGRSSFTPEGRGYLGAHCRGQVGTR